MVERVTKENYSRRLEEVIGRECAERKPRLLLHACCAPCASYVLEYLTAHFDVTVYFYNPNIAPREEYDFRAAELRRLIGEMGLTDRVGLIVADYDESPFRALAKGREGLPEGGGRCYDCYALRLKRTWEEAEAGGFDYFCTTLSISPHKNAEWLNCIGAALAQGGRVRWLPSDFKKKNGYKRSCALSEQYGLYRQDYCGCEYSRLAAEARKKQGETDSR